jgi:hypothetical protein
MYCCLALRRLVLLGVGAGVLVGRRVGVGVVVGFIVGVGEEDT